MNRNIEVINDNLWAVNMGYVESDFIQELTLIPGKTKEHINLTNKGTLIIDKGSKLYPAMKKLLLDIMQKTTDELQNVINRAGDLEELNALDDLIVNLCGWELKRRSVNDEYTKDHLEIRRTIFERIKGYRKRVKKWLEYKRGLN